MAKKWQKIAVAATSVCLAATMAVSFTACGNKSVYDFEKKARTGWKDEKVYTYNEYIASMPSCWNDLAQHDGANTDLMSYINGGFFEYDFKYDENGEIVPGEFEVEYSAATKLEDVTAKYKGRYGITEEMAAEGHHAFAITLRDDLVWDDGTAIHAADFVYTMEQQLSPKYLFENAANYYSSNYIIHNAKNYVYQGQTVLENGSATTVITKDGDKFISPEGTDVKVIVTKGSGWSADSLQAFGGAGYFANFPALAALVEAAVDNADADGGVPLTQEWIDALDAFCKANGGGYEKEYQEFLAYSKTYGELDFSEVGFFVGENENEIVFVIDNTLTPLDADGNLTYQAAYNLASFPLVKKDKWEALAVKTNTPWTNNYCTASVANTASWGPYKLTEFVAGTSYTVERNDKWYGYKMSKYDDQYQTDRIVARYLAEWNTAWQAFQRGEFDGIGINTTIAADYKNTKRAAFTPTTRAYSLHLQSTKAALTKEKGNAMLKYDDFRKALSLAMDRADYASTQTTSSLPLLGYLNEMYYYDVENGGVYRNTVFAKEALLNTYGANKGEDGKWTVGTTKYDDIDDAVDALTGYNITLARELVTKAYNEALAAGDIAEGDTVILRYGAETQDADTERIRAYIEKTFLNALVGTPLEGKLKLEYYMFTSATWATDFINEGKYDIAFGAWYNAPFNPYYMIGAYVLDSNRFALGWDPSSSTFTMNVKGDGSAACPDVNNLTMDIYEWYDCLNGSPECQYNFALYPTDTRLEILAKIEQTILETYWSIPIYAGYTAGLTGYKVEYVTYEYNTFMSFGGIQYMSYNFDDTEWAEFVNSVGGTLDYKI